jgi:4-alpha-glucanotransferase
MKTNLLFGIHCHQPVDNFDRVVYEIIKKSYKPFFDTLKKYPNFKCSVHFSGWLFEFIKKNDFELFSLIKELSPQIEFFTGG